VRPNPAIETDAWLALLAGSSRMFRSALNIEFLGSVR
jgi:hypothetical protein